MYQDTGDFSSREKCQTQRQNFEAVESAGESRILPEARTCYIERLGSFRFATPR